MKRTKEEASHRNKASVLVRAKNFYSQDHSLTKYLHPEEAPRRLEQLDQSPQKKMLTGGRRLVFK